MRHSKHGRSIATRLLTMTLSILLVGCAGTTISSVTTDHTQTLARPAYHFTLTIPAGWTILQEQDAPSQNSPYFVEIGRAHAAPGNAPSSFSLQVLKVAAPGIADSITALASDPSYQPTQIGGLPGFSKLQVNYLIPPTLAPGQTVLPAGTPVAGTPGTIIHGDYEVPTSTLLYTIYSNDVAGENANDALSSIMGSLSIRP